MSNASDKEFIIKLKKRIKEVRLEMGKTQFEAYENRTTITKWESLNYDALPGIVQLRQISNNLGVDLEYLLGLTEVKNKDDKAIADMIHIKESTIDKMKTDPFYGDFLDGLANADPGFLKELNDRINMSALSDMANSPIEANFNKRLIKRLESTYNSYISTSFPSDVSPASFRQSLASEFEKDLSDPRSFVDKYFTDEGINNFKYTSKGKTNSNTVLDMVADFAYNYFTTKDMIERQRELLYSKFVDLAETIINTKKERRYENIRKRNAKRIGSE